jgi:hypothetical protein
VRHAPLLHPDLDDPAVPLLDVDDRRTLGQVVGQRLLDEPYLSAAL